MANSVIGSSIVIDGEISGDEDLVIQGTVKGKIPPPPPGRRSKSSKRFPMTRRRVTSCAFATTSTAASFGDGWEAWASPRCSRHHALPGRTLSPSEFGTIRRELLDHVIVL